MDQRIAPLVFNGFTPSEQMSNIAYYMIQMECIVWQSTSSSYLEFIVDIVISQLFYAWAILVEKMLKYEMIAYLQNFFINLRKFFKISSFRDN